MRMRLLCCSGTCLAAALLWVAVSVGQPPPDQADKKPDDAFKLSVPDPLVPRADLPPQTVPVSPVIARVEPPQTIDQLLNSLTEIRAKKAELEKHEQATIKVLREKLKEQKQRLAALGVALEEESQPKAKEARIEIEVPPLNPAEKK
jgi:hypothetical protein